ARTPAARAACCSRRRNPGRTAASTCPPSAPTRWRRPPAPGWPGSHGRPAAFCCWTARRPSPRPGRRGCFYGHGRDRVFGPERSCCRGFPARAGGRMRAFLIAGEPSGDRLGGALIAGLRELDPALEIAGIGGESMAAQGLASLFPMSELSLMGVWEILPKYRALKRRIAQTAQAVIAAAPDVLITIDSPDFGLRVARLVRAAAPGIRTVHYVAPSVWAWRPGRAAKMAEVIDHVLATLPFEPPLMRADGMSCDFVGHPVVAEPVASPEEAAAFRARHGIAADAPLVLCLPGSRQGEVARLGPRF